MLRIVRYLSKAEIGQMLVALVSIVGQIWLDLTLPDYMADITQLVETPGSEMHDIWVAGGKMLLVSLGSAACAVVTGFIAARVGASFSQRLRSLEFNKVESFGPAEMNRFSTASLITRSTNDITQIQMFITMGLMMIVKAPIMAVWAVCKIAGKGFDWTLATGIAVAICFVLVLIYFVLCFRKRLLRDEKNSGAAVCPQPGTAITNRPAFLLSAGVFLLAVILLATHAQTKLTVACIGVIVAALSLVVIGCTSGGKAVLEIIKGVDYKTLLFFIGLFVSVAGLKETGVLDVIARFITTVSGGNAAIIVVIILWISAVTSAFVDNIPFAATMIPVVRSIAAASGIDMGVLAWALSLGTDLGGNATPIGASANVVGTSVAAKGGYPISWGVYCKYCVGATVLVIAVSMGYLFLR